MQKCGCLAFEKAKKAMNMPALAAEITDELREYARGYFPDITDKQIVENYCVLRTLCTNERDKWSRFRDGTARETISLVPIIDKFTGEIRPAYKEA